jgi:hypothetical protein
MKRVIRSLDLDGLQVEPLAHCRQQAFDGLEGGRDLSSLDAADRCLIGSSAQSEGLLADPMTPTRLPDELSH